MLKPVDKTTAPRIKNDSWYNPNSIHDNEITSTDKVNQVVSLFLLQGTRNQITRSSSL